jgi:nitrite transporter NirC
MFGETLWAMGDVAASKVTSQRRSLTAHLVRSALAGMYVGAAIVLILVVGAAVYATVPALTKPAMGVCFGGALTMVYFAGSELFTGTNLVQTVGVLTRRTGTADLARSWAWTWVGNLLGSALLAVLVVYSGVLSAEPTRSFVLKVTEAKMNLPAGELLARAVLANWLVCLGVWMSARLKSETAKIVMIWWCMFTFIACSFEHSVANMSGLLMGLLLDGGHRPGISWSGYGYNLALATAGNIIGGAGLVAGAYWLASPVARADARTPWNTAGETALARSN